MDRDKEHAKTLVDEVRTMEMAALRVDTPDIKHRVAEAARRYGCSTGLALRILAAKRLSSLMHENDIVEEEVEARLRQARVSTDSEAF
jgi:hypothetical protein